MKIGAKKTKLSVSVENRSIYLEIQETELKIRELLTEVIC
jgi:hypothetical protein